MFLVGSLDVAEPVTLSFFLFFLFLVLYLRREDRREGYPVEETATGRVHPLGGPIDYDSPKVFRLPFGLGEVRTPTGGRDPLRLNARRTARFGSAPLEPVGDPLTAGVGPGAWAPRADRPDITAEGHPRIVPMRLAPGFSIAPGDGDPTGYAVYGVDGVRAGTVAELWIDKSDHLVRYYGVALAAAPGRNVLLPAAMSYVKHGRRAVTTHTLTAAQFAGAPPIASADQITLLEEDKIVGYFGAGHLYAYPERAEPFL